MRADKVIKGISQLASPIGAGPKHGSQMSELAITEQAAIAIADGRVIWAGREADWQGEARSTLDLGGRAVVPGLVDPHTHAIWAGSRLSDFDARTSGVAYEDILARGGGIRSTIRATNAATTEELVALARPRIAALVASGATVIEVKSGYGFTPSEEIRMLEAIQALALATRARILPTLLIHVPPADREKRAPYLDQLRSELIPEVAHRGLATAVDIFVEREAWQADEAESVLQCALQHGLAIKMHAEQFHSVGGLETALRLGARSVDHLEASMPHQFALFSGSRTVATLLPGVSLHLGIPCAPGRKLIDAGAAVAVGTDLNPGSSPLLSTASALALAVRLNGLTMHEALVAGTANAAHALGLSDAGRIEAGLPADFAVLHGADWRELLYTMGANPVREVWIGGERINTSSLEEAL